MNFPNRCARLAEQPAGIDGLGTCRAAQANDRGRLRLRPRARGAWARCVAKSGHVYFDIKDANATLNSVMWKGQAARLPFKPEEGLEVVAEGKLSTYPGRSNYQLIAERMRPAGLGALMQLAGRAQEEAGGGGIVRRRGARSPSPISRGVIGVVTSPTGAVIRDIVHRVRERFPVRVIIWPALVQGERAAAEVEAGIRGFNAIAPGRPIPRPDVSSWRGAAGRLRTSGPSTRSVWRARQLTV